MRARRVLPGGKLGYVRVCRYCQERIGFWAHMFGGICKGCLFRIEHGPGPRRPREYRVQCGLGNAPVERWPAAAAAWAALGHHARGCGGAHAVEPVPPGACRCDLRPEIATRGETFSCAPCGKTWLAMPEGANHYSWYQSSRYVPTHRG